MQNTVNYNLKKPESNEFVNVDDINSNMDMIDEQLKNIDNSKVTKIDGKGLSTNDYTTAEKEKLATLNNYDDSGLRQELSTKADKTTVYTKQETDTQLSEKTGINATATYTNNIVTITAPVSAQQITFIAPSDFIESDTYNLNGTQVTITDLNNEPLSNAWKQGSPVQLIIKGNKAFFKSGGGANDTLPPQIRSFAISSGNTELKLSWLRPSDISAYEGLVIVRKVGSAPSKLSDGTKINLSKTAISYTDTGLTNDTKYYYRAYPYNSKKQYQTELTGAVVSGTPIIVQFAYIGDGPSLSTSRYNIAAASIGNYALFAGGYMVNNVDTINTNIVQSTAPALRTVRAECVGITIGNYALFAGGYNSDGYAVKDVDAYNDNLVRTTVTNLTEQKHSHNATIIGNYALIGGGNNEYGRCSGVQGYRSNLTTVSVTSLSVKRERVSATTVGNYALFAGGADIISTSVYYSSVDAYDTNLVRTSAPALSVERMGAGATTANNRALFAGGYNGSSGNLNSVELYDTNLVRTMGPILSTKKMCMKGKTIDKFAIFGGSDLIDVFDDNMVLYNFKCKSTSHTIATLGKYAFIGGGTNNLGKLDVYKCLL